MLTLYLSPSCTSCRKAKAWLTKYQVKFDERNILTSPLSETEILKVLSLTENGTEDIISTRSKVFQRLDIDLDELPLKDLVLLISEKPALLRRPILIDDNRMQIGFNEDEIRAFLSRDYRRHELKEATLRSEITQ